MPKPLYGPNSYIQKMLVSLIDSKVINMCKKVYGCVYFFKVCFFWIALQCCWKRTKDGPELKVDVMMQLAHQVSLSGHLQLFEYFNLWIVNECCKILKIKPLPLFSSRLEGFSLKPFIGCIKEFNPNTRFLLKYFTFSKSEHITVALMTVDVRMYNVMLEC